jgi:hypothetical protein
VRQKLGVDDVVNPCSGWYTAGGITGEVVVAIATSGIGAEAGGIAKGVSRALPRSGPIPRSLGAMSRAGDLARKLRLNASSPTTRQLLNSLDDTVRSFVGKFRQASINRRLPGEVLDLTVEEALQHSSTVRKLLTDGRFVK